MRVREQAFTAIRNVFKRHGAVEIDTPVFELKEVRTVHSAQTEGWPSACACRWCRSMSLATLSCFSNVFFARFFRVRCFFFCVAWSMRCDPTLKRMVRVSVVHVIVAFFGDGGFDERTLRFFLNGRLGVPTLPHVKMDGLVI